MTQHKFKLCPDLGRKANFHLYLLSTLTQLAGALNVEHLLLLEYPEVITEAVGRKFKAV